MNEFSFSTEDVIGIKKHSAFTEELNKRKENIAKAVKDSKIFECIKNGDYKVEHKFECIKDKNGNITEFLLLAIVSFPSLDNKEIAIVKRLLERIDSIRKMPLVFDSQYSLKVQLEGNDAKIEGQELASIIGSLFPLLRRIDGLLFDEDEAVVSISKIGYCGYCISYVSGLEKEVVFLDKISYSEFYSKLFMKNINN